MLIHHQSSKFHIGFEAGVSMSLTIFFMSLCKFQIRSLIFFIWKNMNINYPTKITIFFLSILFLNRGGGLSAPYGVTDRVVVLAELPCVYSWIWQFSTTTNLLFQNGKRTLAEVKLSKSNLVWSCNFVMHKMYKAFKT